MLFNLNKFLFCLSVCLLLIGSEAAVAGITGTISGTIRDQETGLVLPGANIKVEGTTLGAMADKNGQYVIYNLPAGTYDVTVLMIGYAKYTAINVQVNVDLITELNVELAARVLPLSEVVVTDKRELIHGEVTSSAYFVSGNEINKKLPVDSYRDAISLLPGVIGNYFRGSRQTEVLYMLDGLPLQGGLSREISSYFPNSSIVEMMVQTGGYSAEYGNASGGIVNVVSKDGRNKIQGEVRAYSDFFETGLTGSDNLKRLEFNVGGPMTLGFGGPLINANYFLAADLNLSDTPFANEMRETFSSPVFSNYNINAKLSFDIARNTILALQGLLSNWDWHEYDPQWQFNLRGLAQKKHYSNRLSVSLTHTFSPKFFASLRFGRYDYKRRVDGAEELNSPNVEFDDPTDPNSFIIGGEQPWNEETKEITSLAKLDLVGQIHRDHLLKTGVEIQTSNIQSQSARFDYFPSLGGANSIVANRTSNTYDYTPRYVAFYAQDQIKWRGINANLGLRYDVYSPRIEIKQLPDDFQDLREKVGAPQTAVNSTDKAILSPRFGISLPLSEDERLHLNYGSYSQLPSLYYYYLNGEHSLSGYLPLIGNVDLEPIKTVSAEFSYKRVVADDLLLVITGFTKQFENLIDTQTYLLPDSLITEEMPTVGFSRYTNSASGHARGFEVTLQKRLSTNLSGRISYTWMKARGTSSIAEEEFKFVVQGSEPREQGDQFPLSWDQRHSLIFDLDYESRLLDFNVLYRLFSPLPFTTEGSPIPNNARLSWRNILDLKMQLKMYNLLGGRLVPFFEVRNLFDERNIVRQSDDFGADAYRLFDPINSNNGRRLRMGLDMSF